MYTAQHTILYNSMKSYFAAIGQSGIWKVLGSIGRTVMAVTEMRNCLMSEYERKRTGDKSRPVMRVSTAQKHARILMTLLLYMGGRLHRL